MQRILKKGTVGGLILPYFKGHYKATAADHLCAQWVKTEQQDQWSRIKSQAIDAHIYEGLVLMDSITIVIISLQCMVLE